MKALLLDFDGPIYDARQSALTALIETLSETSSWDENLNTAFNAMPLLASRQMLQVFLPREAIPEERFEDLYRTYKEKLQRFEYAARIDPDIIKSLSHARKLGLKIAIVSNRRQSQLDILVARYGIKNLIDVVIGIKDSLRLKPSPESINLALTELELTPDQVVFIGDSDSDYSAATAASVYYIHAGWTGEPAHSAFASGCNILRSKIELTELVAAMATTIKTIGSGYPSEIHKAIKENDLVFYGGAGISAQSGFDNWVTSYTKIFGILNSSFLLSMCSLIEAAQLLAANPENRSHLFDLIKLHFSKNAKPSDFHFSIVKSAASRIWTTNYDSLLEKAITISETNRNVVRNDEEFKEKLFERNLVVKINGDFDSARYRDDLSWDVVFTEEQFDRMDSTRKEIWSAFESEYRQKCIIFVGSSFSDPALKRLISQASVKLSRTKYKHFLLLRVPRGPFERLKMKLQIENLKRWNIETIPFDSHEAVLDFVSSIAVDSTLPNVAICGSIVKFDKSPDEYDLDAFFDKDGVTIRQLQEAMGELGTSLARNGLGVYSGAAPFVGLDAVASASKVESGRALLFLRESSNRSFYRRAPVEIVNSTSYSDMRRRFIDRVHGAIFVTGRGGKDSGTWEEFELALTRRIPIILLPQAGGMVEKYWIDMINRIREVFYGSNLANPLLDLNYLIKDINLTDLQSYISNSLAADFRKLLIVSIRTNIK